MVTDLIFRGQQICCILKQQRRLERRLHCGIHDKLARDGHHCPHLVQIGGCIRIDKYQSSRYLSSSLQTITRLTVILDDTLKHCLNVSTAQTIISTPDLAPFVKEPLRHFSFSLSAFSHIPSPTDPSITLLTPANLPTPSIIPPTAKGSLKDLACLVYTSGTTGK